MNYLRLTGQDKAFGWQREERVTLGGLRPRQEYLLLYDGGKKELRADSQGAWSGRTPGSVLCVFRGGQAILWNEARLTRAGAQALLTAQRAQASAPKPAPTPAPKPAPPPVVSEEPPVALEKPPEAVEVHYRAPSDAPPVDALPELQWPRQAEQLLPYFRALKPCGLFAAPGWHTVETREAGLNCCFGYRVQGDRVTGLLYGVQARGGLTPPKGLQGYRYERASDGQGYWVLRQQV